LPCEWYIFVARGTGASDINKIRKSKQYLIRGYGVMKNWIIIILKSKQQLRNWTNIQSRASSLLVCIVM
jgi:hypothetical protein